jgi:hypothetical protein
MNLPASVANKRLTPNLTPLDATHTKNKGVAPTAFSGRSDVQTFRRSDDSQGCTRSLALFCRSLHRECFTSLLQSIPSTLFLKTAGVSPNNSHSGLPRAFEGNSPLVTRHCIQVLSAHTLTNAPFANPYGSHPHKCPGAWGLSTFQRSTCKPALDPNVYPPYSYGSLFTDHGSLPRAMLRFNVGGRHE